MPNRLIEPHPFFDSSETQAWIFRPPDTSRLLLTAYCLLPSAYCSLCPDRPRGLLRLREGARLREGNVFADFFFNACLDRALF